MEMGSVRLLFEDRERAWSGLRRRERRRKGKNGDVRVVVDIFFSSRRRHTRLQGDWSSDVCSSDLTLVALALCTISRSIPCTSLDYPRGSSISPHRNYCRS